MGSGIGAGVGGKRLNTGAPNRISVFGLGFGVTTGSSIGSAMSTALGVSIGSARGGSMATGVVESNENENEERGV